VFPGDEGTGRPGILIGTIKVAVVIAGLGYAGATWMASGVDTRSGLQLAGKAVRSYEDPGTTGSLARAAGRHARSLRGAPAP
jgi:hypothetical protein